MVYPARNNKFEVNTTATGATETYVPVKDVESYSVSIDGTVEEWHAFDAEGWVRRLLTAKSISISLSGKRNVGDPGNDYVAEKLTAMGADAETTMKWTLPSGAVFTMPCVINLTTPGGGEATAVDGLEAEFLSNGKPTFTPAT